MDNLTIKTKLILLASISTLGFLITAFFVNNLMYNFQILSKSEVLVEKLNSNTYAIRKHEKDFLARKDLKYIKRFEKAIAKLHDDSKLLLKNLLTQKF